MHPTQQSAQLLVETPLKAKIRKASERLPRQTQWRLYTASLLLADALMIGIAFRLAYFVRFQLSLRFFFQKLEPDLLFYQAVATILIPILITIFMVMGLYDREKLLGGTKEYSMVFNGVTLGMMMVIAVGFLDPHFILARGWLGFSDFFLLQLDDSHCGERCML
jgi:hypothetical protein